MTTPSPAPSLIVLAGPNGAGKSSLYDVVMAPRLAMPFVNADRIQRERLDPADMQAAYTAARMAAEMRDTLIAERRSFVMETVFSHPSKVELVRAAIAAGYRTSLHHVGVEGAQLSVDRVALRVRRGGHPVPDAKIRARYARNGVLIRQAAQLCDRACVWDNSRHATPPRQVLRLREGVRTWAADPLPRWVADLYGANG